MKGFEYSNSNFYNWLNDRINNPSKYGKYMTKSLYLKNFIIQMLKKTKNISLNHSQTHS